MLERIKEMERAGEWQELRRLAETLPNGDALARVHLALSSYREQVATNGTEYRLALGHAEHAAKVAETGSLIYVWSFSKIAAYAADLGDYRKAERAATTFLRSLPLQPEAARNIAVVYFALGRVKHYGGHYSEAVRYWRLAAETAPTDELTERARLNLVWTLAKSGKVVQSMEALPSSVSHVSEGHLDAARAVIYATAGDWTGARNFALSALRHYEAGNWRVYDTVEAAGVLLILKQAAQHAGNFGQAGVWHLYSAATLNGWCEGILSLLVPIPPVRGGEIAHAAFSSCGPRGSKRVGLLGTVVTTTH
jgi:tetratricopeptide (TPR) repeat protein